MRSAPTGRLSGQLLQAAAVLGIVALSVVTTLLVQHLVATPPATAQPTQFAEVRATRFVLVAADGTVLANLEPGGDGNGRLQLFDKTGTLRVGLAGGGALNIADTDGVTPRFRAGYVPYVDSAGRPPINGIWLDPEGSISVVPPTAAQR
jgi:hypothetical protein